jgi:hypothetical protein
VNLVSNGPVSRIAIELQGNYSNLQVNNNTISNAVMGVSVVEGPATTNVSVSGNKIAGGTTAIEASDADMTVANNTITGSYGALSIANTPNSVFENNTITGTTIPIGEDGGYTGKQSVGTNTINGAAVFGWAGHPNASTMMPQPTTSSTTQALAPASTSTSPSISASTSTTAAHLPALHHQPQPQPRPHRYP